MAGGHIANWHIGQQGYGTLPSSQKFLLDNTGVSCQGDLKWKTFKQTKNKTGSLYWLKLKESIGLRHLSPNKWQNWT